MTVRKSWIIAIVLLLITIFLFSTISKRKKRVPKAGNEIVKVAMYTVVKNKELPIIVEASGQLKSKSTYDIYSEVTGVLKSGTKEYRTGTVFKKGELIIQVDDSEARAQLLSQRSDFQNAVTSMITDIKIEFPKEFSKWEDYLMNLDIEKRIKKLPELSSKKEKYFVSSKNIFTKYYTIKNLEARHLKYKHIAPFTGVVTQANINVGGLVRSGQKIGVFSNTDVFELEVSVKAEDTNHIEVGNTVEIKSSEHKNSWKGTVKRINSSIDLNTQTVSVFIETKGKGLKAGMYLDAYMKSKPMKNVSLISREILHNNTFVYLIKDSTLVEFEINPIKYSEKSVMVDNLIDENFLLSKNILGAHANMSVIPKEIKNQ